MSSDTNQKIDKFLRREKLKNIAYIAISGLLIGIVFFIMSAPPMGAKSEVTGTVLTLTASQHDEGHSLLMVVKLEKGNEIFVSIPRSQFYRKGEVVRLLKVEPLFFGKTIYHSRGYVDKVE